MSKEDLKIIRTTEEAKERGRKGGIKSGEVRRAKKTMRETARTLMQMHVVGERNEENLANFGIAKEDRNYQTAMVVRVMQKALVEGDTNAIRLLAELTGEIQRAGYAVQADDDNVDLNIMPNKPICIPDNGRGQRNQDVVGPQAGPQTMFLCSPADIIVYGGAAGGGKTYALLLEMLRNRDVQGFGAVIFRHNFNQITSEGGLWDSSHALYDQIAGAESHKTPKLNWSFDGKSKLSFAHIGSEDDLRSWQGSQIAYIGFDELTHFTKHEFLYMLSRNRSTCGVKPYMRATCNPDADSWVADLISWWIDQDTGYPIESRSGVIRYMTVQNDTIYWADTEEELEDKYDARPEDCKTFTFIASRLEDNKALMEADPSYLASLKALTQVDMERLLYGNWKIKNKSGLMFQRGQVKLVDRMFINPDDIQQVVRGWDLAATSEDENGDPAYTAGVLMAKFKNGGFAVLDVINMRLSAGDVLNLIRNTAKTDNAKYGHVKVRIPQDPGQAGKSQAKFFVSEMAGLDIVARQESGDKVARATPVAAQWQHGFIKVVEGEWNDEYFSQLESFPESKFKDMVDATSSAFDEITNYGVFDIDSLI